MHKENLKRYGITGVIFRESIDIMLLLFDVLMSNYKKIGTIDFFKKCHVQTVQLLFSRTVICRWKDCNCTCLRLARRGSWR